MKLSQEQTKNEEERLMFRNQLTVERDLRLAREQEVDGIRRELDRQVEAVKERDAKVEEMRKTVEEKWE